MIPEGTGLLMAKKIEISSTDLALVFKERLLKSSDCAPTVAIAIVPSNDGWVAASHWLPLDSQHEIGGLRISTDLQIALAPSDLMSPLECWQRQANEDIAKH